MFHNLSGYDAHLFIRELGAHTSEIGVIAKNKEDYISSSIKVPVDSYIDKNGEEKDKLIELRFIDSFKFMSSSLDSLTKNLVRGRKKLFGFEDYSELQYDLLTRKGVYPYEYVNSWDRFNETQLAPIDVFYSNPNMSSISEGRLSTHSASLERIWNPRPRRLSRSISQNRGGSAGKRV